MKLILAVLCLAAVMSGEPTLRIKKNATGSYRLAESQPRRRTLGRVHRILEFADPPTQELMDELSARGVQVVRYLPDNAVVAVSAEEDGLDAPGLIRGSQLEPEQKISADLQLGDAVTAFLVEFHPDVPDADARAIAGETGLIVIEHPDLLAGHLLVEGGASDAAALAEWDEVAYIFPAPADLADGMPVRACGGPLTGPGMIGQYVAQIGEGWDGPGKNAVTLGYSFSRLTAKLPPESTRSIILRALSQWGSAAQISFLASANTAAPRTLNFLFATGDHGDGFAFDGPGRVLAHTFYPAPTNPEPLAGDVHFDDDESWQSPSTVDLYSVALHELGHALGLGHSDKPGAVMYPYYRTLDKLTAEDIQALQNMYAAPAAPSNPPVATGKDTVAPALTIQFPANTSVYTSAASIVVRGAASDNVGVTLVTWATASGLTGNATGTTSWATPAIPLVYGTTTITVRARDAAGNTSWRSLMVTRR